MNYLDSLDWISGPYFHSPGVSLLATFTRMKNLQMYVVPLNPSPSHSLTPSSSSCPLSVSHPHSLTPSHPHSLTPSPPHSLTPSPPHPLTPSLPHPLTPSFPHPLTPSPPHSSPTSWPAPSSFTCSLIRPSPRRQALPGRRPWPHWCTTLAVCRHLPNTGRGRSLIAGKGWGWRSSSQVSLLQRNAISYL